MRENLKNRRNPSHQISENFGKSRNFVIFWYFGFFKVYFVFWYFGCISYFNFEIFKNPQPGVLRFAVNSEWEKIFSFDPEDPDYTAEAGAEFKDQLKMK